jgi:hypothetical protein
MDRWATKFILRCRSLLRSKRVESELDEELRFHLEHHIEQQVARGVPEHEARRAARLALGGLDQQKEACRDARGIALLDHFSRDIRYALRTMRTNPGFAFVAICSLALGIGANAAIFQLIDAVRLRTLPVARAEELTGIRLAGGIGGFGVTENANAQLTFPLWLQIQTQQQAFSGVFAWGTTGFLVGTAPRRGSWPACG